VGVKFQTLRGNVKVNSEVCHPHCGFKLYGEVNSVKNTTIIIWLNDVFISNGKKLHVSAYNGRYRPKHVVFFSISNKHHHLAI